MRTILLAVFAVVLATCAGAWFFFFREAAPPPPSVTPPPVTVVADTPPPAEPAAPAPPAPEVPALTLPVAAEAGSGDALNEGEAPVISIAFHGIVLAGSAGDPVAGATVRLRTSFEEQLSIVPDSALPDLPEAALGASATTDAEGAYRLELKGIHPVSLAMAKLTCEGPGFAQSVVSLESLDTFSEGQEERRDFFLRPGATVGGRVTRSDTGAPVAGAKITALKGSPNPFGNRGVPESPSITATSADDGSYTLTGLEEASYTLTAATGDKALTMPAKARPRVKLLPGQQAQKDLVLSPAATVRGTVTIPKDAARPEHSFLSATRNAKPLEMLSGGMEEMMHDAFAHLSGELAKDNTYEITGLEFGVEYSVHLTAEGFAATNSPPFTIAEGQSPITVDLAVSRGSTLRGKAVFEDGKPAVNIDLQLMRAEGAINSLMDGDFANFMNDCETKDDGSFEMEHVLAGEYKIGARKDVFESFNPFGGDKGDREETLVSVDGINDIGGLVVTVKGNAPAPGTGVITGRLLDQSGNPVVGETIHASGAEAGDDGRAETGADGTFRLERLSEELYHISAWRQGEEAEAMDVPVDTDITLKFAPEAKVSGTVTDAAGNPVDGSTVHFEARKEGLAGMFDPESMFGAMAMMRGDTTQTNAFGLFEAKAPKPGRYVARVTASSAGYGESEAFTIVAGESKSGINIQLAKGVGFSGTVVDSAGKPVVGARVALSETGSGNPMMEQMMDYMPEMMQQGGEGVETDETGAFALYNLAPGDYRLRASADGFAGVSDSVSLVAGRDVTGHKIALAQGGCIAGIASVKGEAKAGLMVQAVGGSGGGTKQKMTEEGGKFEICGLAAGSYMVMVMDIGNMTSGDFSAMMPVMRRVDVRDGETAEVDFGPKEGTVAVRGIVKGDRGQMTSVALQKPGAPQPDLANMFDMDAAMGMLDFMGGQAICNPDGSFVIEEVTPGDYVLEVHSVTIDPQSITENIEAFAQTMKPAIRQNVTVPPGTGLTLELELPAKEE